MAKRNERHVVKNPNGGWDVKAPHAGRASSHHDTQAQAQSAASSILKNQGGGEVVVHRPNGQIRNSNTIAPGNNPCPPKDQR